MIWIILVVALIVVILAILFMNRFYRKASREVALIRTGAGGQRIIMDGGCLSLPFLHRVSEVNMRTTRLEIERAGDRSVITKDRLRVDTIVEFYVRVDPSDDGVATAAQALAGKTFRASELAGTLEGKLVDAVLSVAATYTMDELQNRRGEYVREVSDLLRENLAQNGLVLESVSLTRMDQTPFHTLDENNAFNAVGMRRLAEIVATSKKERAVIEADADVSVRQSKLDATKKRLLIEQEEEEAQIAQHLHIETQRADSEAKVAEEQASAEERREQARINREREVKAMEIAMGRAVRERELEASQNSEIRKLERDVAVTLKAAEVTRAQAATERAKSEEIEAKEQLLTIRETAEAEREKQLALIRATEQAEVDDTRVHSETGTIMAMAKAEAEASEVRAGAEKTGLLARAEGEAALIEAENSRSEDLIRMKLHLRKLETLPKVVDSMMKPAEKIDSIRIHHISGFGGLGAGGGGGGGGDGQGGERAMVNQVVDGILSMALQLPAVKKLGEEIGINIGGGLKGLIGEEPEAPQAPSGSSEQEEGKD